MRLLPVLDDRDPGGFWAAAARGELVVRTCRNCDASLHLPRAHCSACGENDPWWRPVRGLARLYSWTVVEHQVHPGYPAPYTVVLVELDDAPGVRLIGYLAGRPDLRADQPMRVRFEQIDEETTLPQWEPVVEEGT
jgi:uncharacterized protein